MTEHEQDKQDKRGMYPRFKPTSDWKKQMFKTVPIKSAENIEQFWLKKEADEHHDTGKTGISR